MLALAPAAFTESSPKSPSAAGVPRKPLVELSVEPPATSFGTITGDTPGVR